ncbi:hypothetical protein [Microbacterium rhizophilus]|uniref:hypothetical protein n=1 Tax=Microbacterium rhizophilus TaxID=3138934 RepID=UPI0031ED705C
MLGLPAEAAPTAWGLRFLVGVENRLLVDPQRIAAMLYPAEPRAAASERVVLHILMLEEAGHLRTWVQDGREWLALLVPFESPPSALQAPPAPPAPSVSFTEPPLFSTAGEREEEREEARARARERARAQAAAEDQARSERWAAWEAEYATSTKPLRPLRPALLDAPPIGCAEHPEGTREPCGPCGTARERRRAFLVKQQYVEQLSIFEERWGDDPF